MSHAKGSLFVRMWKMSWAVVRDHPKRFFLFSLFFFLYSLIGGILVPRLQWPVWAAVVSKLTLYLVFEILVVLPFLSFVCCAVAGSHDSSESISYTKLLKGFRIKTILTVILLFIGESIVVQIITSLFSLFNQWKDLSVPNSVGGVLTLLAFLVSFALTFALTIVVMWSSAAILSEQMGVRTAIQQTLYTCTKRTVGCILAGLAILFFAMLILISLLLTIGTIPRQWLSYPQFMLVSIPVIAACLFVASTSMLFKDIVLLSARSLTLSDEQDQETAQTEPEPFTEEDAQIYFDEYFAGRDPDDQNAAPDLTGPADQEEPDDR